MRPDRAGSQLIAAWNAMQHVINKLAHGGPLVPLTVPVSPRLRRTLKAYLEWGGVVGLVVNAIPRGLREALAPSSDAAWQRRFFRRAPD